MKSKLKLGFVGLSHLGLVYMASAAQKGFKVFGFDTHNKLIENLRRYKINFSEPKLKDILIKNHKKIQFSSEIKNLRQCDLVFLSQDVPVSKLGKSDYRSLKKYLDQIKKNLNKNSELIILSQVYPSFTRSIDWNKKKLYYQVETLVFGNAVKRALKPERIIIGQSDLRNKISPKILSFYKNFNCPIIKMSYESAELTKISINLFLISNITLTNKISEICEHLNANWDDISRALKFDKRIGKYSYLNPGFGISGGNLLRDLSTIKNISSQFNLDSKLFNDFEYYSKYFKNWCLNKLKKIKINPKDRISIFGLTYKENTSSTKNSFSLFLLNKLKKNRIFLNDDIINVKKICDSNKNFFETKNYLDALKKSKIIFFLIPSKNYKKINHVKRINIFKEKIIFDPFKIINNKKIINNCQLYLSLGIKNEI